ncbi:conserved hypothetical protein [Burkholderia pseudomallei 305]|nr:conserved hypothetical protein [Burkholderia pseudomallei 305]
MAHVWQPMKKCDASRRQSFFAAPIPHRTMRVPRAGARARAYAQAAAARGHAGAHGLRRCVIFERIRSAMPARCRIAENGGNHAKYRHSNSRRASSPLARRSPTETPA